MEQVCSIPLKHQPEGGCLIKLSSASFRLHTCLESRQFSIHRLCPFIMLAKAILNSSTELQQQVIQACKERTSFH